jgi:glycosyltransferase involved in cell wall biosynthesis
VGEPDVTRRVAIDVSAIPDQPVGAGRYVVELVRHLSRRGRVDLVLICRRADATRWQALAPAAQVNAVVPAPRGFRLAWEQIAMGRHVASGGVEVLHSPHYTMPRLPRGAVVGRVVTVHDMTFFDHPEWHERRKVPVFRRAIRAAAARADAVVCVSNTTADRLRHLLRPRGAVHVIPHGVDHERFCPDDPGDDDARLAALGVRAPFIAFLSTIQPRKDVPTLVRAFDLVATEHPDAQLVVAGGSGWGQAPVDAAMAASTHRDRIVRPGWIPDDAVPALYRRAAVVAYPALVEGFGLPALEALASGAPLVTTRGTAMEEIAGDAAHLVEPGDVDGLAAALARCLGRGPDVEDRRQRGITTAGRYTWDATAAAHEDVYLATRSRLGWPE